MTLKKQNKYLFPKGNGKNAKKKSPCLQSKLSNEFQNTSF